MFRRIYLSPVGFFISLFLNLISFLKKPFMVYGFFNKIDKKFYNKTRISSTVKFVNKINIDIQNNVWVGHYCILDGIGGIKIEKGVQLASHACIYTHSSENAIRLNGEKFIEIPAKVRPGYIIKPVFIGEYSLIGTSAVLLCGTSIGKASIVGAGSIVKGSFPDYSVIVGNPAKVVGDTRKIDKKLFLDGINFDNYYDQTLVSSNYSVK